MGGRTDHITMCSPCARNGLITLCECGTGLSHAVRNGLIVCCAGHRSHSEGVETDPLRMTTSKSQLHGTVPPLGHDWPKSLGHDWPNSLGHNWPKSLWRCRARLLYTPCTCVSDHGHWSSKVVALTRGGACMVRLRKAPGGTLHKSPVPIASH